MAHQPRRRTSRVRVAVCAVLSLALLILLAGAVGTLSPDPVWVGRGGQQIAAYGVSVAGAGDVNGDGHDDVLVGASIYDSSKEDGGRVFFYLGSPAGLPQAQDWLVDGVHREAWLGFQVAGAGDVNGDGFADIMAGAHGFSEDLTERGAAYVWHGSEGGPSPGPGPDWTALGDRASAFFGKAVAAAGDVNGDGYDDVIVGAFGYTDTFPGQGAAYVYFGSAEGLAEEPQWSIAGSQAGESLGFVVAGAGDVDGDGYDDVLVGAHLHDGPFPDSGRVRLYPGSPDGPTTAAVLVLDGGETAGYFGHAVTGAGDVNGDGYGDVLVGAPGVDGLLPDEGRAYLFEGSPDGLSTESTWSVDGGQGGAFFGIAASAAGDVNQDGMADIVIGASLFDTEQNNVGQARLYLGSPQGASTQPAWTAVGVDRGDLFGSAVAPAGDVDGDSFDDVLVGAQAAGQSIFVEGQAYLYVGVRPDAFPLRVLRMGNGAGAVSSDPPGVDCGTDCEEFYATGTAVVLTALPGLDSVFGGWMGDPDCTDGALEMTLARNCTALFHLESELCVDQDEDGFGSPPSRLCAGGNLEDCDDLEASVHPGAPDVCDGLDNNCDGSADAVVCDAFDVNADGLVDGVELAWIGRAFGVESTGLGPEWWVPVDYNHDSRVDGDDLGLLGSVWSCSEIEDVCE